MSKWKKIIGYFVSVLFILFIASLFFTSYTASVYLLLGIVVAWLVTHILSRFNKSGWLRIFAILFTLLLGFICVAVLSLINLPLVNMAPPASQFECVQGDKTLQTEITEYHAVVEPINFIEGSFRLFEDVVYNVEEKTCISDNDFTILMVEEKTAFSLPERKIYSSNRGFFIREVQISPLEGSPIQGLICCLTNDTVELRNFPQGAYYDARDVLNEEKSSYLSKEIVRWENRSLSEDIEFAYVAYPFYFMSNLLAPLIGISYQSNWVMAFIGLIAATITEPIIKPVLINFFKSRFKSFLDRKAVKKSVKKSSGDKTISGDGGETEDRKN